MAIAGRQDRQLAFGDPRVRFLVEIGAVDQLHALKQPFVERARDRSEPFRTVDAVARMIPEDERVLRLRGAERLHQVRRVEGIGIAHEERIEMR